MTPIRKVTGKAKKIALLHSIWVAALKRGISIYWEDRISDEVKRWRESLIKA